MSASVQVMPEHYPSVVYNMLSSCTCRMVCKVK